MVDWSGRNTDIIKSNHGIVSVLPLFYFISFFISKNFPLLFKLVSDDLEEEMFLFLKVQFILDLHTHKNGVCVPKFYFQNSKIKFYTIYLSLCSLSKTHDKRSGCHATCINCSWICTFIFLILSSTYFSLEKFILFAAIFPLENG